MRPLPIIAIVTASVVSLGIINQRQAPAAQESTTARESMSIDTTHSNAHFRVQHLGAGRFWGRFNDVDGAVSWTPGSTNDLDFDISIDVESVDSGVDQLDRHLKSPDFFNAKEFPNMTFKSQSAKKMSDDTYEVKGNLTMHGVTKPITAMVEWLGSNETSKGKKVGFEATFKINRSDFGMNYGVEKGALGNEVDVIVAMEANVQP